MPPLGELPDEALLALVARPQRTFLWLGIDSVAMLVIYAGGIALLTRVVG